MQNVAASLRRIDQNVVKGGAVSGLIADKSGVTAVEYGLIAALIAVAAVVVMTTVGTDLSSVFSEVAASL